MPNEDVEKASHKADTVELRQAIVDHGNGEYVAVLSDNSVDRENEIIGEPALKDMKQTIESEDKTLSALLDHENKVENLVAEYQNPDLVELDGNQSLVAEPKFFTANPKAEQVKGMLDQGANIGVSISAIPQTTDEVERDGKTFKRYTELETVEASFTPIPANRHARATSLAKSYAGKQEDGADDDKEASSADFSLTKADDILNLMESDDTDKADSTDELTKQVSEHEEAIKGLADQLGEVSDKVDQVLEGIERSTKGDDADDEDEDDEEEMSDNSKSHDDEESVADYVERSLNKDAHESAESSEPVRKHVSGDRDELAQRKAEAESDEDEAEKADDADDTAEKSGVPFVQQSNLTS